MAPTRTGATRRRTSTARATTTRRRSAPANKGVGLAGFGFYSNLYGPIINGFIEGMTWLGKCVETLDHQLAHQQVQTGMAPAAPAIPLPPGIGLVGVPTTTSRSRRTTKSQQHLVGV